MFARWIYPVQFLWDNKILNSVPIETPIIAVGIKVLGDIIHREKKKNTQRKDSKLSAMENQKFQALINSTEIFSNFYKE